MSDPTTPLMKAHLLSHPGQPSTFLPTHIPKPAPLPGHVVMAIKAFGINHAEMHMRRGEWAEAAEVSGIECVGVVDSCPGGEFKVGDRVAALMGGLGRTVNGSYAEYTRVGVGNVVGLGEGGGLGWTEVAAIPESYATAWTCLFRNLELSRNQTLLIRGGTSSFGQAAINLAVNAGAYVIATTRNLNSTQMLLDLGVKHVVQEGSGLSERLTDQKPIDAILNLVGNSVLLESLAVVRRGGRVCLAGFLGGLDPIVDFNPLLQMPSGVHFSFFGSFVFGTPSFPLSDVPLNDIVNDVARGRYKAKPARVFEFDEIMEAHEVMEKGEAGGKLVVRVAD